MVRYRESRQERNIYLGPPKFSCYSRRDCQLKRLQNIQNSVGRAVVHYVQAPMLKSLHWLRINQRVKR